MCKMMNDKTKRPSLLLPSVPSARERHRHVPDDANAVHADSSLTSDASPQSLTTTLSMTSPNSNDDGDCGCHKILTKSDGEINQNDKDKNETLPLMSHAAQLNRSFRPNSILKQWSGHKRSCSLGQSKCDTIAANTCGCNDEIRTKSVSILTPSQEKDENELWRMSVDEKSLPANDANAIQMSHVNDDGDVCGDSEFYDSEGHMNPQQLHYNSDGISLYSIHMEKDFRYYFQHPYARLFVSYFVVFCNFLIFAEDPLSHSSAECSIPVLGNVISFVGTKYPPEWPWIIVKVSLWIAAIFVGLIVGKLIVHHILLRRILRLKMFRDESGTWMIMFLFVFISCYFFSILYNILLSSAHPRAHLYVINTFMGMSYSNFMKAAACGTWIGDFFTAWMITDMMLQDNLYPMWAPRLRKFWFRYASIRIVIFWTGAFIIMAIVISVIVTDKIDWDHLNRDFVASTELSRAFLASSILVMDLLIVMQDWDFPHFVCDLDIKLPGLKQASYTLQFFKKSLKCPDFVFHISGKWFNYGIIVCVMMLDLNMWKNQIIYSPPDYGQYTDPKHHKVFTVSDSELLATGNQSFWTYNSRASEINPYTNKTYIETDLMINSRYLGYPALVKGMAFLPCAAGFILFFTLIYQYGRFPPKTDASAGGRLKKRLRDRASSWRRERRDSRLGGYISWRGITIYGGNSVKHKKEEIQSRM